MILPFRGPGALASAQVKGVTNDVVWADAFILASPDYHGSIPGATKNFLDNFYPEFAGEVFAYIIASHEKGLTAMDPMKTAIRQCYEWSLPYGFAISGDQDFADGRIAN